MSSIMDQMAANMGTSDRGTELFIILTVVFATAWIFVLLRGYTRFFIIKNMAADDWWMFAAMVGYTGYYFNAVYGILVGGTGRHITELSVEQIYVGLKGWYIEEILYAPVSAMVRTSVALFLLRVSVQSVHQWIIIITLSAVWVISFVFVFVVTFQCNPPSYFYDQVLGLEGHCMDISVVPDVTIAHSVIGALCDLMFATLPIAMLWNVQLNKRTKVVIAILLGMGAVAGIALLVRIPYVKVLAISPDFLFETIDVAIWSVLEPSLGIIAGCIATLRPLFKGLGIGRDTTHGYEFASSRRTHTAGGGPGSDRTRLSARSGAQKLVDGPYTPDTLTTTNPSLRGETGSGLGFTRRWTSSSTCSGDIEMQAAEAMHGSAKGTVRTKIMSSQEERREPDPETSGLLGISVYTSIHTESLPRAPASSLPKQPWSAVTQGQGGL